MRAALRASRPRFIEPCLPSPAAKPPTGDGWLHEIKHDGYRLMARRDGGGVRLLTRNGHDYTSRYPSVAQAVYRLRCTSCVIDGEVAIPDARGLTVFDLLRHGPQIKPAAILYAFDLVEIDGRDLRRETIEVRKATLVRVLRGGLAGLQLSEHLEGDAAVIFQHACKLGAEGIVSKRKGSRYRSGRSTDWLKMKNPKAPAVKREAEEDWNR